MKRKIKIVAHRGYSKRYPENTILAFEKAVEVGVDSIELDVHWTCDKKLVVHHDYYLGKTDNGSGPIYSRASKYIKSLDAGSWKSKRFRGEKIPFLPEVFENFRGKTKFEVELKGFSPDFVEAIVLEVKKFDLFSDIEFTSWHIPLLSYLKRKVPKAKIGLFVASSPEWMSRSLAQEIVYGELTAGDFSVAHLPFPILDSVFIKRLRKIGALVHAADCNKRSEIIKAISVGIDQISTENLELALEIRANYEQI